MTNITYVDNFNLLRLHLWYKQEKSGAESIVKNDVLKQFSITAITTQQIHVNAHMRAAENIDVEL